MIFTKTEDCPPDYYCAKQSDTGIFIMGILPVMFGYRVVIGFKNSGYYEVNLCCGNNQEGVEYIYSLLQSILLDFDEKTPDLYHVFMRFKMKPIFVDDEYMRYLNSLNYQDFEIEELPSLIKLKMQMLEDIAALK